MRTLRISVRRLVEFLLRSGNIDSQNDWRGGVEAMQAGSNIHRMLQASAGDSYQAEVSLAGTFFFPGGTFDPYAARLPIDKKAVSDQEGFFLHVEGRADGVIDDGVSPLTVDEIKGVSRDVSSIQEPIAIHEAQALCYAYLYLRGKRGPAALSSAFNEQVAIRLTYASMDTGEVRQIERTRGVPDIEAWFFSLLDAAQRWAAWRVRHEGQRERSLRSLGFPFRLRGGQLEIMDAVAAAIHKGGSLYLQAPTGSGKTIATVYPALKAMGSGEVSRIAFLTAKTMTRQPVLECLDLLRQRGMAANVLVVTARNKICPLRGNAHGAGMRARPLSSLCNPVECPLARGHYDLANDALYEAITTSELLDCNHIKEVAVRHHVCPYELQRDAAQWADVIVCDYHYAFAPSASLIGLADGPSNDGTVYLVDEAHNLVERMRNMYSAELSLADLKELERLLGSRMAPGQSELLKAMRAVVLAFPAGDKTLPKRDGSGKEGRGSRVGYRVAHVDDDFVERLSAFVDAADATLEQLLREAGNARTHESHARHLDAGTIEVYLALRDASNAVRSFLGALQRAEAGYVTILVRDKGRGRKLKVLCVNPARDLGDRLEQAKAAVFFSGTLLPMEYHRKLLAAQDDDPTLYAQSSFDYGRQQVLIGSDVSARYSRRGPELYARVAKYLVALVRARPGNYLVFLPSYAMMGEVAKALDLVVDSKIAVARQQAGMREDERERFVARFRTAGSGDAGKGASLVGLCVLGGVFGESIDLPGESLIGVVVVGTGMPVATHEREVIRDYFDAKEGKGFVYAYTYPGMIKVLQAAGRLIRTERDHGVVLLLDDRFLEAELQKAFPKEWESVRACTLKTLPGLLAVSGGRFY
ncbi:MAG: ATP-dependent DNA helicase [Atopobiaceae bacterium]|nr:ATP-dependent DNA helicase [Atopobiaceae bacterium]